MPVRRLQHVLRPRHVQPLIPVPRRLPVRLLSSTTLRANVPTWPQPLGQPQTPVNPSDDAIQQVMSEKNKSTEGRSKSFLETWSSSPSFQAALTTVVGLMMVFVGGVGYLSWYKSHVLHRMERAFAPGFDPALEMHSEESLHIERDEQPLIDSIVRGEHAGSYYLMIGPNGTGKGTLILNAMRKIQADGAAILEGHPDLEVVRLRLGKSLDFDYFEDWQGSLFSRADPRSAGPALDIERALNKLEKVALRYKAKKGRPIVLVFNEIHLIPNSPEGHALLHQLQQRAEAWAEGGICTMVFSTDDFWCLDMMKKNASRMQVLSVYDLPPHEAISALRRIRTSTLRHRYGPDAKVENDAILRQVYDLVGGRMSHLTRVSRAGDMLKRAEQMVEDEMHWLQSKIGLIPDHDDDVMDEQKWASCSWLLLRHLAKLPEDEQYVSYGEARRIMTRTDFIEPLDAYQVIAIDRRHRIRLDSTLMLRAVERAIAEEGFDDLLDQTRARVDEIEGLHRQNELTIKEPFKIVVDKGGRQFDVIGLGDSFNPPDEPS
ncbi:hypothetical protein BD324DRAFT_623651 [Kockovaella imperatae]|uniref:AAA protein C-terminal winged helix domain-containing protein n=1 Tax=Kockovaella imperatae TaxID=4999 RepID=A0A1Y1UIK0_9TREE|nr:hypothetical protein BD324DRAFT_623651 [Kockovaella imperatae]ORX37880.1 hypothetical protein BD324DRAFT_623651 [Kockovaella imperatae]